MQTASDAKRYLVSRRNSNGTNSAGEMRVFDCESDARDHILEGQKEFAATSNAWYLKNPDWAWKLYEVSPIKKPRRIAVTTKYLGYEE